MNEDKNTGYGISINGGSYAGDPRVVCVNNTVTYRDKVKTLINGEPAESWLKNHPPMFINCEVKK